MKNIEVRQAIEKKRLKHYEVAERLGVDACTFSRWLNCKEMNPERKKEVMRAIKSIK